MIALLTDFQESEYVGIMKGVIHSIKEDAIICDITHKVTRHNIREGAWILLNSYSFFPNNTIFLCVVDPGVGTKRNAIVIKTNNYCFVGPDNGLMYPAAKSDGINSIRKLNSNKNNSKTFHGRDIFAKVAAFIENRSDIKKLGSKTKEISALKFFLHKRVGEIVRIDSFGNIITNLCPLNKNRYNVYYNNYKYLLKYYEVYNQAKNDELFLITGSCNTLEISLKNGSAINKFPCCLNDKIEIK